ncbi:MAG: metallophosphoesterase [Clostridia bacterium]|nr:metallophosphoesterase [Clostridia bacterium]
MIVKSVFLRVMATLLASFMIAVSGSGALEAYDVRDPENCKLNFTVLSDVHVEGNNFNRYKIYSRCLQNVTRNKSGNDAVLFLGDNTMNGQNIENMLFHGTAAVLLKDENIIPVMGNHDIGNGEGDYETLQNRWYSYTNSFFGLSLHHPYYYKVVDGYYFIVLGMEDQLVYEMTITDEQFEWLESTLSLAAQSGKPAFVFSHYPADDACDESGRYTDRLVDMLAEYNKTNDLFYFCGHTHMPLYLFWSFHNSDGFPETYLPRLTELAGSGDNEIYDNSGIGVEVELYENELVIRGRDFYNGEWRYEDDVPCEVTYQLKNPVH